MKEYIVTTEQGANQQFHELIRCKDCAYWTDADTEHLAGYCHYREAEEITFSFEYCAWAERKDDETD